MIETTKPTRKVARPASVGAACKPVETRRAVLVFHLAGQAYGLPLPDVQKVLPMARLARSPSLPAVLAGFLNLAGTAVAVLRLDRLFGLPEQPSGLYTPLVLLRHANPPMALLVDKVSRILHVSEDTVLPVREDHSFNGSVEGMTSVEGEVILLLSPERLLLDKEQQCLAEFQDQERARLEGLEGTAS